MVKGLFTSLILICFLLGGWRLFRKYQVFQAQLLDALPEFYEYKLQRVKKIEITIENYLDHKDAIEEIKIGTNQLYFPIPDEPEKQDEWMDKYKKLGAPFHSKEFKLSIENQSFFILLPPKKVAKLIVSSAETIHEHLDAALDKSIELVKIKALEGFNEISESDLSEVTHEFLNSLLLHYDLTDFEKFSLLHYALDIKLGSNLIQLVDDKNLDEIQRLVDPEEIRPSIEGIVSEEMELAKDEITEAVCDDIIDSLIQFPTMTAIKTGFKMVENLHAGKSNFQEAFINALNEITKKITRTTTGAILGFAIGGPLGAYICAFTLNTLANFLEKSEKKEKIHHELNIFKKELNKSNREINSIIDSKTARIISYINLRKKNLKEKVDDTPNLREKELELLYEQLENAYKKDIQAFINRLVELRKSNFYKLPFFKTKIDEYLELLNNRLHVKIDVDTMEKGIITISHLPVSKAGYFEKTIKTVSEKLKKLNANLASDILVWDTRILAYHRESLHKIAEFSDKEFEKMNNNIEKEKKKIKDAKEEFDKKVKNL